MHVVFDESCNDISIESICRDYLERNFGDLSVRDKGKETLSSKEEVSLNEKKEESSSSVPKVWRYASSHPKDLIIGHPKQGVKSRSFINLFNNLAFVSQIEPKSIKDAKNDEFWILALQEELNQFERNKVWELVPRPSSISIIGTK